MRTVKIIYEFPEIYGELAHCCAAWLKKNGYAVQLYFPKTDLLETDTTPDAIHLYLGSGSLMKKMADSELSPNARHVLWVFMLLSMENEADRFTCDVTRIFNEAAPKCDLVLSMNKINLRHIESLNLSIPAFFLPKFIDTAAFRPISPMALRPHGLLFLSTPSKRRNMAIQNFRDAGIDIEYSAMVWGEERKKRYQTHAMSLQVSKMNLAYFDQFRTFNAWINGLAVIGEPAIDSHDFGVENGKELFYYSMEELPQQYLRLKTDFKRLEYSVEQGRALLKEKYSVEQKGNELLDLLRELQF